LAQAECLVDMAIAKNPGPQATESGSCTGCTDGAVLFALRACQALLRLGIGDADVSRLLRRQLRQCWPVPSALEAEAKVASDGCAEVCCAQHKTDSQRDATLTSAEFDADPQVLLHRLLLCIDACKGEVDVGDMRVQTLAENEDNCSVWLARFADSNIPCVCSEVWLPTVSCEAAANAIYNREDRMRWDKESFVIYEVLQTGVVLPGSLSVVADVVYCRMPAPTGLSDRQVCQQRFFFRVPGGVAIVMCSLPDTQSASLRRPASAGAVRAQTVLSGYVLRTADKGGVVISVVSQTDLGGAIPSWAQGMAKKSSKRRLASWAHRLEDYCRQELHGALTGAATEAMSLLADAQACSCKGGGDIAVEQLQKPFEISSAAPAAIANTNVNGGKLLSIEQHVLCKQWACNTVRLMLTLSLLLAWALMLSRLFAWRLHI